MANLTGKKPSEFDDATIIAIRDILETKPRFKKFIAIVQHDGLSANNPTVNILNQSDGDYLGVVSFITDQDNGYFYATSNHLFVSDKTIITTDLWQLNSQSALPGFIIDDSNIQWGLNAINCPVVIQVRQD